MNFNKSFSYYKKINSSTTKDCTTQYLPPQCSCIMGHTCRHTGKTVEPLAMQAEQAVGKGPCYFYSETKEAVMYEHLWVLCSWTSHSNLE